MVSAPHGANDQFPL